MQVVDNQLNKVFARTNEVISSKYFKINKLILTTYDLLLTTESVKSNPLFNLYQKLSENQNKSYFHKQQSAHFLAFFDWKGGNAILLN